MTCYNVIELKGKVLFFSHVLEFKIWDLKAGIAKNTMEWINFDEKRI